MHSSLVSLLKKKYVYEDTIQELIRRYDLTQEDIQEFYEMYPWNIRSFKGDDENNIKFFMQDICKYPTLSAEEEEQLLDRSLKWDKAAKEKLILHMTGYVIAMAKKFTGLWLSLLDLVSEWLLGVEKAISLYKPDKSNRLSTYANRRIHNYILIALAEFNGIIWLPLHLISEIKLIDSVEQKLFQQFNRIPTQDEIISAVQEEYYRWRHIAKDRIVKILLLKQGPLSLSHTLTCLTGDSADKWDDTIGDYIKDPNTPDPLEECDKKAKKNNIIYLIDNTLDRRDASIIKMRYGIGCPKYTLKQIGENLGITRERIRQIEKRFVVKVRREPQLNMFLFS